MKKIYFLLLVSSVAFSQVTLKITGLPTTTPANATIYLAGSINSWNEANPAYIMQPDGLGNLQLVIPQGTGTVSYKFTRGSWATVEGNATGGFLPDRTFTFSASPQTINLTIQSWEDLGTGANGTAAENVQILSNSFRHSTIEYDQKNLVVFATRLCDFHQTISGSVYARRTKFV